MANAPKTTRNPSPKPDDPRYPRPTWLRAIRSLFLHWWLILLTCAIILILIYLLDRPSLNQLLPFLIQYWWILILLLIAVIVLLFRAYTWAYSDNRNEFYILQERQHKALAQQRLERQRQQRELEQRQQWELEQQRQKALEQQPPPPGFKLHNTLQGHTEEINQITWSPDGRLLASASNDGSIRLWDTQTAHLLHTLSAHSRYVFSVAWSPDGRLLASASDDHTIRLWDTQTAHLLHTLSAHSNTVWSVAWSPDGHLLASASDDHTIRLWDAQTTHLLHTLSGHSSPVWSVAWSLDGRLLASASNDGSIRLWDAQTTHSLHTLSGHSSLVYSMAWFPDGHLLASDSADGTIFLWNAATGRQTRTLEGHTTSIMGISFSADNRLLASKSIDETVRLWNLDTWEEIALLNESSSGYINSGVAFHPKLPILATLGEQDTIIRIWHLDLATILRRTPATTSVHYTNAKAVLVGDSGVGKSGLGLVLSKQAFVPTESTHGRYVWPFDSREVELGNGGKENREILLWDLAGQPGYRLVHQLHLNEVAVALVVFDAHSETDPFAGVHHWDRALRIAQRTQGSSAPPMQKFLVAARVDRGGAAVSRARIDALLRELGFAGYFETSAKEGKGTEALAGAILAAINWEVLPKVSSNDLFQRIKDFLAAEKESGRRLSTVDDLYHTFLKVESAPPDAENLRAQFETCIGRMESRGLIRRLSFGNFVLLQPELLDAYASALVNAVKDEPEGFGSIAEAKVQAGDFSIPRDERINNKEQEKLLLLAMVEDLLHSEIALRETADDGLHLVFPSQSTRENPELPDPAGKTTIFSFEGPVQNIYATLTVRLSHSGLFKKKELWKNAVTYQASVGGTCGLFLHNIGEGRGEFTLFYD
ncbi:MAG: eIF2A-related protein [Ktedonobacteraceae bacterium]